jgi:menaquinone-specific isochorismate synthase
VTTAAVSDALSLTVRSVPVSDPGVALVDLLATADGVAWSRNGEGLIGWGTTARLRCSGPKRFAKAQRWWDRTVRHSAVRDEVRLPGSGLVAFGAFAYADGSGAASLLTVPEVVVGHRAGQWWVTTVGVDGQLPPPPPDLTTATVPAPGVVRFADGALSSADWEAAVAAAVGHINAGALDKVVLARDLDVRTSDPIDPRWALRRLASRYPSCFTFAVDGLLGATPELLVRIEGSLVTSRVLAGTIRRTGIADPGSSPWPGRWPVPARTSRNTSTRSPRSPKRWLRTARA